MGKKVDFTLIKCLKAAEAVLLKHIAKALRAGLPTEAQCLRLAEIRRRMKKEMGRG